MKFFVSIFLLLFIQFSNARNDPTLDPIGGGAGATADIFTAMGGDDREDAGIARKSTSAIVDKLTGLPVGGPMAKGISDRVTGILDGAGDGKRGGIAKRITNPIKGMFGGDGSPIGRLVDNIGSRTDGVGNSKRVVRPGTTRTPIIASGTRRRPKSDDEFA